MLIGALAAMVLYPCPAGSHRLKNGDCQNAGALILATESAGNCPYPRYSEGNQWFTYDANWEKAHPEPDVGQGPYLGAPWRRPKEARVRACRRGYVPMRLWPLNTR